MYEFFEKLCDNMGITPYKFSKDTGVSTSTLSTWKAKNSQCSPKIAKKVCDYFGVSIDYLMTGKEPTDRKYSAEMAFLLGKIRNDKDLSEALLKYFELPEEKKKHIVATINMLCEGK